MLIRLGSLFALLLSLLWAFGYLGSSRPKLVVVSGKVTLDGQPLEGALVSMKPVNATSSFGRPSNAMTNSHGEFTPTSYGDVAGIPIGRYKVAVRKQELPANLNLELPGSVPVLIKWLTPRFYSDPESSGLEVEVTARGMEPELIKLETIGPIEIQNSGRPVNYDDP